MSATAAPGTPPERLQVIGLVSGGKDSLWALCETRRLGHAIVCLANLRPPAPGEGEGGSGAAGAAAGDADELDSLLVQTVGHSCVPAIAECLTPDSGAEGGTPLVRRATRGRAVCTALGYTPPPPPAAAADGPASTVVDGSTDEVEDLFLLLRECVRRFPHANAVVCGAVLSHYQRLRVEAVCRRLALQPLAWLWGRGQRGLLDDMVRGGVEAVLVKVAAFGLSAAMLGRPVGALQADFARLGDLVGLNECGEGGEYETITLDCPLFETRRVRLGRVRVVEAGGGGGGGSAAAHLAVLECGTEPKGSAAGAARPLAQREAHAEELGSAAPTAVSVAAEALLLHGADNDVESEGGGDSAPSAPEGSVVCVSSVVAGAAGDAADSGVAGEARSAFAELRRRLERVGAALSDVCYVNLCESALRAPPATDVFDTVRTQPVSPLSTNTRVPCPQTLTICVISLT